MSKLVTEFKIFSKHLFYNRRILLSLAYNDFRTRYAGSMLGGVWAFIKPVVTIMVFWFVFQVGLKTTPIDDFPFILWLISGMIPWFFLSDALLGATYSLYEYSYLVKKVKFRVSVLPIVKITASFFVHMFFFILIFILFLGYRQPITIYSIQLIYYTVALFILLVGITWTTSALAVFLKDVGQMVEVALQVLIWLTPILWNYRITIPKNYQWMIKVNPFVYIIDGFRDAFIYQTWFFEKPLETLYYWSVTVISLALGSFLFVKLRPHFADVL